ncbi:MAG: FAD-dependent oxidoreductase [Nitrospirota bacterium]
MNKAKVTEKKVLTHDIFELYFETQEPFNFEAGQFITIKIADSNPKPCFRAYSISSSPAKNTFELCIKEIPNGRGSSWLNTLKSGDKIEFIGPNGKFNFTSNPSKKILFIATGTGIAPLKSIIEYQLNKENKQQMHLYFGVRHIKDIFYKEHFEELAKTHDNFSFNLTLSQPEDESWSGNEGRVTSLLEPLEIDPDNTEAYICGLKAMIDSVHEILTKKGLKEEAVHHEKYD